MKQIKRSPLLIAVQFVLQQLFILLPFQANAKSTSIDAYSRYLKQKPAVEEISKQKPIYFLDLETPTTTWVDTLSVFGYLNSYKGLAKNHKCSIETAFKKLVLSIAPSTSALASQLQSLPTNCLLDDQPILNQDAIKGGKITVKEIVEPIQNIIGSYKYRPIWNNGLSDFFQYFLESMYQSLAQFNSPALAEGIFKPLFTKMDLLFSFKDTRWVVTETPDGYKEGDVIKINHFGWAHSSIVDGKENQFSFWLSSGDYYTDAVAELVLPNGEIQYLGGVGKYLDQEKSQLLQNRRGFIDYFIFPFKLTENSAIGTYKIKQVHLFKFGHKLPSGVPNRAREHDQIELSQLESRVLFSAVESDSSFVYGTVQSNPFERQSEISGNGQERKEDFSLSEFVQNIFAWKDVSETNNPSPNVMGSADDVEKQISDEQREQIEKALTAEQEKRPFTQAIATLLKLLQENPDVESVRKAISIVKSESEELIKNQPQLKESKYLLDILIEVWATYHQKLSGLNLVNEFSELLYVGIENEQIKKELLDSAIQFDRELMTFRSALEQLDLSKSENQNKLLDSSLRMAKWGSQYHELLIGGQNSKGKTIANPRVERVIPIFYEFLGKLSDPIVKSSFANIFNSLGYQFISEPKVKPEISELKTLRPKVVDADSNYIEISIKRPFVMDKALRIQKAMLDYLANESSKDKKIGGAADSVPAEQIKQDDDEYKVSKVLLELLRPDGKSIFINGELSIQTQQSLQSLRFDEEHRVGFHIPLPRLSVEGQYKVSKVWMIYYDPGKSQNISVFNVSSDKIESDKNQLAFEFLKGDSIETILGRLDDRSFMMGMDKFVASYEDGNVVDFDSAEIIRATRGQHSIGVIFFPADNRFAFYRCVGGEDKEFFDSDKCYIIRAKGRHQNIEMSEPGLYSYIVDSGENVGNNYKLLIKMWSDNQTTVLQKLLNYRSMDEIDWIRNDYPKMVSNKMQEYFDVSVYSMAGFFGLAGIAQAEIYIGSKLFSPEKLQKMLRDERAKDIRKHRKTIRKLVDSGNMKKLDKYYKSYEKGLVKKSEALSQRAIQRQNYDFKMMNLGKGISSKFNPYLEYLRPVLVLVGIVGTATAATYFADEFIHESLVNQEISLTAIDELYRSYKYVESDARNKSNQYVEVTHGDQIQDKEIIDAMEVALIEALESFNKLQSDELEKMLNDYYQQKCEEERQPKCTGQELKEYRKYFEGGWL